MVDYQINLAKTLTSSAKERASFYNKMLMYLIFCSLGLICVVYTSTVNLLGFVRNKQAHTRLLTEASEETGVDKSAFKNTHQAYTELQAYSRRISEVRQVLGQRVELLPIVHNLFLDLPSEVVLQSFSATKDQMAFGLTMPPASIGEGDSVRELKIAWENNEELMKRVASIRPLTGERRTTGAESVFYVKFECVLKK